jgi:mRNA interferase RelE/StbE
MKIIQSPLFARKIKKFHKNQKLKVDDAIRKLVKTPAIGEEKKGDLKGIFVYKFKISTTQYLLAYRLNEKVLELITIGPHENYYQDLKGYLKSKS